MKKARKLLVTLFILFAASVLMVGCKKTVKYTVTYNPNGGTLNSEAVIKVNKDSLLNKPADPTKTDHEFLGWYISDDGGATFIQEWNYATRKVQGNITLYANWEFVGVEPGVIDLIEDLLDTGKNNDEVAVEGIIYYLGSDGFYISDSELGKIFVEYNTTGKNITVNKEASVEGKLSVSGNVRKIIATEVSLKDDADPLVPLSKTVKEIVSLSNLAKTGSWYGYFKVVGRVEYDQALMEINLYSDDNQDFLIIDSRSDVEYLKGYQGERVELEVVLSGYDNFSSLWAVRYVKEKVEEAYFSSAEIRGFAADYFASTVNDEILGGGLVLPATLPNIASLTITWTTDLGDYILINPLDEDQNEYQTVITIPEQDKNGKLTASIQYKNLEPIIVEVDVVVKKLEKTSLELAISEEAYMSMFDAVVIGFAAGQNITFKSYIIQDLNNPNVVITADYYGNVNDGFDTYIDDVEIGDILTFIAQYRKEGRPCFVAVKTTKTNDKQDPVYNLEGAPALNKDNFGDFPGYNMFVKLENPYLQYSTSGIPAITNWVRLGYPGSMTNSFGIESSKTLAFLIRPLDELMGEDFRSSLEIPFSGGEPIEYDGDIYGFVLYESDSYFQFVAVNTEHFVPSHRLSVINDLKYLVPEVLEEGNLDFITTHEYVTGTITWASDKENIISNSGEVIYPEYDTIVTLTVKFMVDDLEDEQTLIIIVQVAGQVRVVYELDEAMAAENLVKFNVRGYVLQIGYSDSVSDPSTSELDVIFLQDRTSGKIVMVRGLEDKYEDDTIKIGYEIEFLTEISEASGVRSLVFKGDLRVTDEAATLVDYKDNAIVITSHTDALVELSKDFHYGQVFKIEGPAFFNSTTSTGHITNLRFHLNENALGVADVRYGGKSLVFNVNSNKPIIGEDFVEDLFGFDANPGTVYPGTLKHVDLYFVIKRASDTYYYCVLLDENDVLVMNANLIVEREITRSMPKDMIAGDIVLPATHELIDGDFTWVSDKPEVIANDGSITYPDEEVVVLLTASFKIETIDYEFSVEVIVKPPVPFSVSQIILESQTNDTVLVEGIVVGFHWNGSTTTVNAESNGIIIKDETGNEILYVIGLYENYGDALAEYVVGEHTLAKGDKIRFIATYNIAASEGHAGRKTLIIQSVEAANLKVLESEVTYEFDLDSAVEVSKQDDLAEIAENLPYGTLFKLTGDFGFRGSASAYGTGVNLQTSYKRTAATDYNMAPSWADRGQRFSFKFDGNVPNLGNNWWISLLGIDSQTYTGTNNAGMSFEEGAYIYFYLGHSLPRASTANGYIQLVILDSSWVNATLKTGE